MPQAAAFATSVVLLMRMHAWTMRPLSVEPTCLARLIINLAAMQPVHPAPDVFVLHHSRSGADCQDHPQHHAQRRGALFLVRCSPATRSSKLSFCPCCSHAEQHCCETRSRAPGNEYRPGAHTTADSVWRPGSPAFRNFLRRCCAGLQPISLFVEEQNPRAWPGGVGCHKIASNYAPTIAPQARHPNAGRLWPERTNCLHHRLRVNF